MNEKPATSTGAWINFPQYKTPIDVVTQNISLLRNNPKAFLPGLPQIPLPNEYKNGDHLPIELEIAFLLKLGAVGDSPRSMITCDELLAAAKQAWNMNDDDWQKFQEKVLPDAKVWLNELRLRERQEAILKREQDNLFFLNT